MNWQSGAMSAHNKRVLFAPIDRRTPYRPSRDGPVTSAKGMMFPFFV